MVYVERRLLQREARPRGPESSQQSVQDVGGSSGTGKDLLEREDIGRHPLLGEQPTDLIGSELV